MRSATYSILSILSFLLFATSCSKDEDVMVLPATKTVAVVNVTPGTVNFSSLGESVQLDVEAVDNTGEALSSQSFTWTSSNENIASVSNDGLVTALQSGSVTITASTDGVSGTAQVHVMQEVTSLEINPSSHTFTEIGSTFNFTATALDAGGTTVDLTDVNWKSSDPDIVSIGKNGTATATGQGETTISVSANGLQAQATVLVRLVVANLEISQDEMDLTIGGSATLSVVATDPSGVAITAPDLTWSSTEPDVATVDENGVVTGVSMGGAFVKATSNGIVAHAKVNVRPPFDPSGVWKGSGIQNGVLFEIEFTLTDEGNGVIGSQNGFTNSIGVGCNGYMINHFGFELEGTHSGTAISINKPDQSIRLQGTIVNENKIIVKLTTTVPLGVCQATFQEAIVTLTKQ